jgi:hypothetical protein
VTSQYKNASLAARPAPVVPDFASIIISSGVIKLASNNGINGNCAAVG